MKKFFVEFPQKNRPKFNNVVAPAYVTALLSAEIVERCPSGEGAQLKFFSLPEKNNSRRRAIFEPRWLNTLKPSRLPTHQDITNFAVNARSNGSNITSIDFRSFYYQILLEPQVRKFFGVKINGEYYQMTVLPQGASMSVLIAQTISTAIARLWQAQTTLVYIDNIYLLNRSNATKSLEIPFEIGFEEEYNTESTVKILGMIINLKEETIDVDQRVRNVMETRCRLNNWTVRDVLSAFGTLLYTARVLHIPMCTTAEHTRMMKDLATTCRSFLLGEVGLDDPCEALQKHCENK